ncbi:response regulator transcription factor [Kitasatospora sp. NBC_01287]|uniref:response regulator n=1 Tax=Kitasatospora sp. NBC_01287 TaxID=2903573 RepID=UPI00224E69E0|nr:response regulator transcription factor [Kitasatospora sp. NBC_01287]MCX4745759.1 response regulator transcription factor [Kitasatospora sp. NBC_01287]
MTVRVLVADDDALLRAGVSLVLGSEPGIEVVGQAADGLRAVQLCRELAPDVVLMDVRMPGIDGVEATRRIVADGLTAQVLVLTTFHHDDYVWGALRAGAAGFLLKRASPERLIDAVLTLAAGEAVLDPAVTRDLVAQVIGRDPHRPPAGRATSSAPPLAQLTAREREVLVLAAEGCSNAEIAALLIVAESTVKTHMKRVLAKTAARDRAQAVAIAYRSGLMASEA